MSQRKLLDDPDQVMGPPTQEQDNSARALLINFIFMSACFSANHGSVTSVIALASSFNETLGSYSLGVLYACYVLTAMLAAQSIMAVTSQKWALIAPLALYSIYVVSYVVASLAPATAWYTVLFGATIGGIGAGLLWTAQGAYFKANAKLYAQAKGISEEEANGYFSSVFASFYLGLEVSLKVIGSLVSSYADSGSLGQNLIYAVYTIVAVAATLLITTIRPMYTEGQSNDPKSINFLEKVTSALRLLCTNPKCALMVPTNFAFGFAAAFITAYVQGTIIAPVNISGDDDTRDDDDAMTTEEERHTSRVLLYSSLAVGTATVLAMPFNSLRNKAGTPPVMFTGAAAFIFVSVLSLSVPPYHLRHMLWLLYMVYGCGRCIWESTVKAIFADFFTAEESPAAFANIILQSGISSCFAFFAFPHFSGEAKGLILAITAAVGYVCFVIADRINQSQKSRSLLTGNDLA